MVRVEERKFTPVLRGSQMVFNKDYLKENGFDPAGKYTVVYEHGKMTIAKELKSAEVKEANKDSRILTTEPPYEIDTVEHDIEIKRNIKEE